MDCSLSPSPLKESKGHRDITPTVGLIVRESESTSTSSTASSIIPNANYRWRVVRLVPYLPGSQDHEFRVEIFSSGTRAWRMLDVFFPQKKINDSCTSLGHGLYNSPVAYYGKLYWLRVDGCYTFALDPFTDSGNPTAKCSFRKVPDHVTLSGIDLTYLGVCGGRLRMCVLTPLGRGDPFRVWGLKGDVEVEDSASVGGGSVKWLAERISLPCKDIPFFSKQTCCSIYCLLTLLGFYSNNEDIIYQSLEREIVVCKLCGGGTLEIVKKIPYTDRDMGQCVFPFVLLGWPMPVPQQQLL